MAAINELRVSDQGGLTNQIARRVISEFFWSWFQQNSDDVILEKKLFWFSVKIRVFDLKPLFERLFGSMPASVL